MIKVSTGVRNNMMTAKSARELFNEGCAKLIYYGGAAAPADADAAATGSVLCTFTNASATAKAKQKIRFTPTPGTAAAAEWSITLNGVKFTFTDDGTPSAAEICTGLYNLIRAGIGTTAITTPAGAINIPDVYGLFTLTDNSGTLDIESATAGLSFEYTAAVGGAGAGTGSWATAGITADAYGLRFEDVGDVASGIMEKLASQVWSGKATADGTGVYWRLVLDSDTGVLSTTEARIQGTLGTTGSDIIMRGTTLIVLDATYTIDSLSITLPASA